MLIHISKSIVLLTEFLFYQYYILSFFCLDENLDIWQSVHLVIFSGSTFMGISRGILHPLRRTISTADYSHYPQSSLVILCVLGNYNHHDVISVVEQVDILQHLYMDAIMYSRGLSRGLIIAFSCHHLHQSPSLCCVIHEFLVCEVHVNLVKYQHLVLDDQKSVDLWCQLKLFSQLSNYYFFLNCNNDGVRSICWQSSRITLVFAY